MQPTIVRALRNKLKRRGYKSIMIHKHKDGVYYISVHEPIFGVRLTGFLTIAEMNNIRL